MATTLEQSTFQKRPAYRYIRGTDKLPTTEEARAEEEPVARVKLFDPTGSWTWYVSGYDPDTRIAWGLVDGFEKETGDFSMAELVELRVGFGLPLERDLHWRPRPLSELAA
ncbi:hypothetical protein LCGC14_0391680 [marine sediment metagenome]|uniref:DUF2958 domain-containing protein n=1 Tax=marine sediment metagenome TaxID=412755 RepID=A0A0F9THK0_9ZZZZ